MTEPIFCRFVQSCGRADHVSARKFLDAAMKTGNRLVFFSVFKFFEERNLRLYGTPTFPPNELCDVYCQYFFATFGKSSAIATTTTTTTLHDRELV